MKEEDIEEDYVDSDFDIDENEEQDEKAENDDDEDETKRKRSKRGVVTKAYKVMRLYLRIKLIL